MDRMRRFAIFLGGYSALGLAAGGDIPAGGPIGLALRTRDPGTGAIRVRPISIDPRRAGIVIVDPWEYHWCMTWTEGAGGMAPRINRALQCARRLGMPVFWGPTDTAGMFSGWPQRQRAMAIPYVPVPAVRKAECRWTVPWGACLCGPGVSCIVNYGFEGMDPRLEIGEDDLIVSGTQELYSHAKAGGLSHLIYFGGATNICLTGKDIGLGPMYAAGLETIFARDIAFAWTEYVPSRGYTPSIGNAQAADDLERAGIPTVLFVDACRGLGLWDEAWITEPVRITPAGTIDRPYLFEAAVTVSLEAPYLEGAAIHYTLDGSDPSPATPRYGNPFALTETSSLRTAAFRDGKKVSLDGRALFVRLPPAPPEPDVPLDDIPRVDDLYGKLNPTTAACLWEPRSGASFEGQPLRVRGRVHAAGLGMRAPAYARYDLRPEYLRFVALAGADDRMLDRELGRTIAKYPSVAFKVFLDGRLAAESPVMRISQEPWRFDVPIPPGSRQIVLVCDDAGSRSPYDLGNWVEAGFVLREGAARERIRATRENGPWRAITVPGYWERAPGGRWAAHDGRAWYRAYVLVPASWAGKGATLHVECVDNRHETFFDGRKVGEGELDRVDVSRSALGAGDIRPGEYNLVAIRVEDVGGAGGFAKESPVLFCGEEAIELAGTWEFRTGDDPAWAAWPVGSEPPGFARFEKVVPAALVPRREAAAR